MQLVNAHKHKLYKQENILEQRIPVKIFFTVELNPKVSHPTANRKTFLEAEKTVK